MIKKPVETKQAPIVVVKFPRCRGKSKFGGPVPCTKKKTVVGRRR